MRGKNRSTSGSSINRSRSTNGCKHGLTKGEGRSLSRGTNSKPNNWSRDTHRSSRSCKIDNSKGTGILEGEKSLDDSQSQIHGTAAIASVLFTRKIRCARSENPIAYVRLPDPTLQGFSFPKFSPICFLKVEVLQLRRWRSGRDSGWCLAGQLCSPSAVPCRDYRYLRAMVVTLLT